MIPSFPLLSCELSVSVKENLDRKIKLAKHQKVSKYYEDDCRYFESNILKMKYLEIPGFSHLKFEILINKYLYKGVKSLVFSGLSVYP